MKKIFIILVLGSTALFSSMGSFAGPHFGGDDDSRGGGWQGRNFDRPDDENRVRERRMREERGVKRLQQHKWQPGYVMPQHYRGNGYKVDYQEHNLPRPERKQQWYKINQDYILVDVENHHILRIAGL